MSGDEDRSESLAIASRDYSDIAKLQQVSILDQFLEHPTTAALETITGAFAGGGKGLIVSAGRIAQGLVKGQIYEALAHELRQLREAGKLPDNLGETKFGLHTWAELCAIIDDECPDPDRLNALKAMFYGVNKVNATDAERIKAYQLWQIAKNLDSGKLIVMKAVRQHPQMLEQNLIDETGFGTTELVRLHSGKLKELTLLSQSSGPNGWLYDLTALGKELCQNLQTYHNDLNQATHTAGESE